MSAVTEATEPTLLEAVTERLRSCRVVADGVAPPAAILWTDPERQWLPLLDAVRVRLPELFVLGEFAPEERKGPAIWLRCVVERTVDVPNLPEEAVPILYLPDVGRQQLRAGTECPRELQPLVELMYRGTLWLQKGGHDWTVTAFLTSPLGLGLDLARDEDTLSALPRALPEVAATPLEQLRGRRLEADDFDRLLTPDLYRDLLRWMSDPRGWRERMSPERWESFRSQCRTQLDFDPEADGEVAAGLKLGSGERAWGGAWDRFEEAPAAYPGIPDLLTRSRPTDPDLFVDRTRWPDENDDAEEELRKALGEVPGLAHGDACARIRELEEEHGPRRAWVWAGMGRAPLAGALEPLADLAEHARSTVGGGTPEEIGDTYAAAPWRADASSWQALALAPSAEERLIQRVVRHLMEPWLDESARVFQRAAEARPLPTHEEAQLVEVPAGACLVFADGLRYDLGCVLAERLEARGCRVHLGRRWAALPTVTATAKPAVSPAARDISGESLPEDFAPALASSGRAVIASRLRAALDEAGYQVLGGELGDWPGSDEARGWSEEGEVDSLGHKLGIGLARQIDVQLDRLAERIVGLLDGGWESVRLVTDHGWLLLPGGLPRIDLPKHLTASRWSRCATISGASEVSVPTAPWHWNPQEWFATGPGIACFNASPAYAHGGISLQECLIPDMLIERSEAGTPRARIDSVTWRRMRCIVEATVAGGEVRADLRLGRALGPSVAATVKALDADGRTSLVVEDDEHEGEEMTLVLLDQEGTVLAQQLTRVGDHT